MDQKLCLKLFFLLCSNSLWFSSISSDLTYYGNEAKERSTSGMDSSIRSIGPCIWIDDPLNCESCPRWGYLQSYSVYIHASPTPSALPLPRLYLQVWSNTTMINNYTLKWQESLDNYQPGNLYKVYPVEMVEVNITDRIGFTSTGNGSAIALDLETDDPETMSTAHRTYFRLLYRDNYVLPSVGGSAYVDNNALRGRFSVGIELDNGPPRKSTEVYIGHDLIHRPTSDQPFFMTDESVALVSGRVTAFYFRLAQLTTTTTPIQLFIWQKTNSNSFNYILTYTRSLTLSQGPEQTYQVSISDGPLVDSSHRFGWNISSGLFYSSSNSGNIHRSLSPPGTTFTVGQTYAFDALAYSYDMSIGVIVDQQQLTSTVSSSSSMVSSTSTRHPNPDLSIPTSKSSYDDKSSSSSAAFTSSSNSSTNNGLSTPPVGVEKQSKSSAINWNQMSIIRLLVTLHLLITCLSS